MTSQIVESNVEFFADIADQNSIDDLLEWARKLLTREWVDQDAFVNASRAASLAQKAIGLQLRNQFNSHFADFQYYAFPQVLTELKVDFSPIPLFGDGGQLNLYQTRSSSLWVHWIEGRRQTTWLERLNSRNKETTTPIWRNIYTRIYKLDGKNCPGVPLLVYRMVPRLRDLSIEDEQMLVFVDDDAGTSLFFAVAVGSGCYILTKWKSNQLVVPNIF